MLGAPGRSDREPQGQVQHEDQADEDEDARPGQSVLLNVGTRRVCEDLNRQRWEGVIRIERQQPASQRREQQRGGFAGDTRDREHDAGDDTPGRAGDDDVHDRSRFR